jgi:hypothetical protein
MMLMQWLGIILIAALLAIAPGFASAQPAKDTSPATQPQGPEVKGEAAGKVVSYTPEERQAYEKKTAADIEMMEKRVGDLVTKARKVVPQKRRQVITIMHGLQVRVMVAREQLAALEKAPADTWSGLKPGMDKAMADLKKTWEESAPYLQL